MWGFSNFERRVVLFGLECPERVWFGFECPERVLSGLRVLDGPLLVKCNVNIDNDLCDPFEVSWEIPCHE